MRVVKLHRRWSQSLSAVFACGKSLNLLRICEPRHFLFSPGVAPPPLAITFAPDVGRSINRDSELSALQAIAAAGRAAQQYRGAMHGLQLAHEARSGHVTHPPPFTLQRHTRRLHAAAQALAQRRVDAVLEAVARTRRAADQQRDNEERQRRGKRESQERMKVCAAHLTTLC